MQLFCILQLGGRCRPNQHFDIEIVEHPSRLANRYSALLLTLLGHALLPRNSINKLEQCIINAFLDCEIA